MIATESIPPIDCPSPSEVPLLIPRTTLPLVIEPALQCWLNVRSTMGASELRSITRMSDVIAEAMINFEESGVNVNDDPPVETGF